MGMDRKEIVSTYADTKNTQDLVASVASSLANSKVRLGKAIADNDAVAIGNELVNIEMCSYVLKAVAVRLTGVQ